MYFDGRTWRLKGIRIRYSRNAVPRYLRGLDNGFSCANMWLRLIMVEKSGRKVLEMSGLFFILFM
ncbi:hypothetical protein WG66_005830 [Moniliophthora roreri]|nr:hypothetical protein WG66_005830 [Moniliophthora roreri]